MLANGAQHNHAHTLVLVERLEYKPQLVALSHLNDIERRTIKNDIRALLFGVQLDFEAVVRRQARVVESHRDHAAIPYERALSSVSNSSVTSLRRKSLIKHQVLVKSDYLLSQIEQRIGEFVDYYNDPRYHENLDSLTPTNVCFVQGHSETEGKHQRKLSRNSGGAVANRQPKFQTE